MARYQVRVWITDIEVEAATPREAEDKAVDLIDNGNANISAEYSEVQKVLRDGMWRYVSRDEIEEAEGV